MAWNDTTRAKAAIARHAKYQDPAFVSRDVRIKVRKDTALVLRMAATVAGMKEQDFIHHLIATYLIENGNPEDGAPTR